MINPFEKIVSKGAGSGLGEPEQLPGEFACQRCFVPVDKAYYYEELELLIWKCPDEHKSHLEGVTFD